MASKSVTRIGPKLGKKQIFLPNFTLTLLRTPKSPPTFATFIVPLNLNKLDLRDYLWNCYGVPVRGVRSYIQMQKLSQDKPNAKKKQPRKWFRPRSIKKMMVEMERPFMWPEEPENLELWENTNYKEAKEEQEKGEAQMRPDAKEKPDPERESIAKQAKSLLKGNSIWEDVGEAREVEADVHI